MKRFSTHNVIFLIVLAILFGSPFAVYADVQIMSYNIKDFWLRFDGESGTVTDEGAELDRDDLEKLEIIAAVINEKKSHVIGILECASLAELIFFNERFLEDEYRCWSFRAYDSRITGIPLGLMVKKELQVKSVNLIEPRQSQCNWGKSTQTLFCISIKPYFRVRRSYPKSSQENKKKWFVPGSRYLSTSIRSSES